MHKPFQYWKTIVWSLIMLILFMLPASSLSNAPSVPHAAEAAHVFLFAGFTFFFILDQMRIKSLSRPLLSTYVKAVIYSTVFGMGIELLQSLLRSGRNAEFSDVLFDVAGSLFSVGTVFLYFLVYHQGKSTD